MRATGPRGILIEQIRLNGRSTLRVTMRGVLIGKGHYTTPAEALAALQQWGIDPDDLVFDYSTRDRARRRRSGLRVTAVDEAFVLTWHGRPLADLTADELAQAVDSLTAELPDDDPMTLALRRLLDKRRRNERPSI